MNLIYFIAFAAILVGILYGFNALMRRWTGYDARIDPDEYVVFGRRTDWGERGLAEKRAAADAEEARKTRKAKIQGYYEEANINTDEDILIDADFPHLETGYSGETETVVSVAALLDAEEQEQRSS